MCCLLKCFYYWSIIHNFIIYKRLYHIWEPLKEYQFFRMVESYLGQTKYMPLSIHNREILVTKSCFHLATSICLVKSFQQFPQIVPFTSNQITVELYLPLVYQLSIFVHKVHISCWERGSVNWAWFGFPGTKFNMSMSQSSRISSIRFNIWDSMIDCGVSLA